MILPLPKVAPLVAKPRAAAFDHPDWLFELKYDGFRALIEIGGAGVWHDGEDLRVQPLLERKKRLKRLLRRSPLIVPAFGVDGRGLDLMATVNAHDLEGILLSARAIPAGMACVGRRPKTPLMVEARGELFNGPSRRISEPAMTAGRSFAASGVCKPDQT